MKGSLQPRSPGTSAAPLLSVASMNLFVAAASRVGSPRFTRHAGVS